MQMALPLFNMNKLPFVVLSQFWLKTSRFPQNGLDWLRPAFLGRFGDSDHVPLMCGGVSCAPLVVRL